MDAHCFKLFGFVRNKLGSKPVQVFRGAYGKLSILRSMCKDGEERIHVFFLYIYIEG